MEFGSMNVLIGANGAGKSSVLDFFRLLNEMVAGRLQQFIAEQGCAQSLLFHGPRRTPQLEAELEFETDAGRYLYEMRLSHAAGDTLVFASESLEFQRTGVATRPQPVSLGAGHVESRIRDEADRGLPNAKDFRHLLSTCGVYHFHDTSSTARVRQAGCVSDQKLLTYDAGNLAAFLYGLKKLDDTGAYRRIAGTIQLIAPFFEDFDLGPGWPGGKEIFLYWRKKGSDQLFGPHQLSDGMLRAMCLVTLLLQPIETMPRLIIVDEPELGLHPCALNVIAGLFQSASRRTQVLVSTQSSAFLDNFDPEDVVVVDRNAGGSVFSRPDLNKLSAWLEEYSLGEVWEKNILAGGPH
jgi:predicted ATPase